MQILNNKSMSLVEILVAMFVFTIALGALLNCILSIIYLLDVSKETTIAVSDSRTMMERIRATPFSNIPANFPDSVADGVGGNSYQNILGSYTLKNEHITVTYANVNADPLEIKIEVTWRDKRGRNRGYF